MDKEALAKEILNMHLKNAKKLVELMDVLMSAGEDGVLYLLYENNNRCTAGKLSERIGVTTGRMANILKSLEKKQYVERERDKQDKRIVYVKLMDKGIARIKEEYDKQLAMHMKFIEKLGEEDTRHFMRIIEKIVD